MDEYIMRGTAIEAIKTDIMGGLNYRGILERLPAAKVAPVIEAEWIEHEDDSIGQYWECSHCHVSFCLIEGDMYYKRCPECGAVMKAVRRVTG